MKRSEQLRLSKDFADTCLKAFGLVAIASFLMSATARFVDCNHGAFPMALGLGAMGVAAGILYFAGWLVFLHFSLDEAAEEGMHEPEVTLGWYETIVGVFLLAIIVVGLAAVLFTQFMTVNQDATCMEDPVFGFVGSIIEVIKE